VPLIILAVWIGLYPSRSSIAEHVGRPRRGPREPAVSAAAERGDCGATPAPAAQAPVAPVLATPGSPQPDAVVAAVQPSSQAATGMQAFGMAPCSDTSAAAGDGGVRR